MPTAPGIGSFTTLYTQAQRAAIGATWPDGNVGLLPTTGGAYLGIGANPLGTNPGTQPDYFKSNRTIGTYPSIGATSYADIGEVGVPGAYAYAGGGPMVRMSDNSIVRVVHTEVHDHGTFWAVLNLARSTNEGVSWTFLGAIIQPGESLATFLASTNLHGGTDIGGGPIVLAGGFYYIWFMEFAPSYALTAVWKTDLYISAARCDRVSFDAAVLAGTVPTFKKWDGAGWTANALTGQGAVVDVNSRVGAFLDVWFLPWCGCFFMVAPQVSPSRATVCGTSKDGIHWSAALTITDVGEYVAPHVTSYTTVVPPKFGTISRQAAGNQVGIMYDYMDPGNFWGDHAMRFRTLSFHTGSRRTGAARFKGGPNAAYMR